MKNRIEVDLDTNKVAELLIIKAVESFVGESTDPEAMEAWDMIKKQLVENRHLEDLITLTTNQ